MSEQGRYQVVTLRLNRDELAAASFFALACGHPGASAQGILYALSTLYRATRQGLTPAQLAELLNYLARVEQLDRQRAGQPAGIDI